MSTIEQLNENYYYYVSLYVNDEMKKDCWELGQNIDSDNPDIFISKWEIDLPQPTVNDLLELNNADVLAHRDSLKETNEGL